MYEAKVNQPGTTSCDKKLFQKFAFSIKKVKVISILANNTIFSRINLFNKLISSTVITLLRICNSVEIEEFSIVTYLIIEPKLLKSKDYRVKNTQPHLQQSG